MGGPRAAFTLVELMIVVAIIGILAAIAIPNFHTMQLKAKRAELELNVDGIANATRSWSASSEQTWMFLTRFDEWTPDGNPGKSTRPWDSRSWPGEIGFSPDGDVRGSYSFGFANMADCSDAAMPMGFCTGEGEVCVRAISDLDEDRTVACFATSPGGSGQFQSDPDAY